MFETGYMPFSNTALLRFPALSAPEQSRLGSWIRAPNFLGDLFDVFPIRHIETQYISADNVVLC